MESKICLHLTFNLSENVTRKIFLTLRQTNTDEEFKRMKENVEKYRNKDSSKVGIADLLKGYVWKPLGISMGIMFFQQFSGINAVIFYTVSIFESAGTHMDSHYETIIIGSVQLISTILSGFMVSIK